LVDPSLSIAAVHNFSDDMEIGIQEIEHSTDVTIHPEPMDTS
jgi:divalent metal cation (Fe/Co/Zn/Cd) transporter